MPAPVQRRGLGAEESLPSSERQQRKVGPNYEGSFVVKRAFSGGALVLANMDGEELPSFVNSDVVKRYYA